MSKSWSNIHWSFPFIFSLILLSIFFKQESATLKARQFDPDAGFVGSPTKHAIISASSNPQDIQQVIDGNTATAWQSAAPLPYDFLKNKEQNILLEKKALVRENTILQAAHNLTDGHLNTVAQVTAAAGIREIYFPLNNQKLIAVSIKCQTAKEIKLIAEFHSGETAFLGNYLPENNFELIRWEKELSEVRFIKISSQENFSVFEIAALSDFPKEYIQFNFQQPQRIGVLKTKCWAGENAAAKTILWTSLDGKKWEQVAVLNPNITTDQLVSFPERLVSYIKLEHTLYPTDWNKVFLWEVNVYDKNGPYGERPSPVRSMTSIKELLGVNGYWSWGTDQYSSMLGPDRGPALYANVASHARNYHNLTWDLQHPGQLIDFSKMKERGTNSKSWLDWDREYEAWVAAGLTIDASLQFYNFQPQDWRAPYQSAYQYAQAFVNHFGQKNGNGLVCTIEAGNEPWSYPADLYRQILSGMVDGAKAADASMEVLPCALQAVDPDAEHAGIFKNYIGARVTAETAAKLDGLNVHAYSYKTNYFGIRKAVHPEAELSTFWEINNMVRWRDKNMPGKKIYLTEWGWDNSGGGENCIHQECVSEDAAAAYAIRGALIANRLGAERATWFFYANTLGASSLYTRSGLTASSENNFQKKMAFLNIEALIKIAGNGYFQKIIKEDQEAWAYLYGDQNGQPMFIIAWLPNESHPEKKALVSMKIPFRFSSAIKLNGHSKNGQLLNLPGEKDGNYYLELSTFPTVFFIEK